jgi:hypothetical protein
VGVSEDEYSSLIDSTNSLAADTAALTTSEAYTQSKIVALQEDTVNMNNNNDEQDTSVASPSATTSTQDGLIIGWNLYAA